MSDIEIALADLGEIATREIAKEKKPQGLNENIKIAKKGGLIADTTRKNLEKELERSVITNDNKLPYSYEEEIKVIKE